MFACEPCEYPIVGARDRYVQMLHTDVEGSGPMDNVSLVFGHFKAARLAAVVWPETVALEEVTQGDVVVSVVLHLYHTAGEQCTQGGIQKDHTAGEQFTQGAYRKITLQGNSAHRGPTERSHCRGTVHTGGHTEISHCRGTVHTGGHTERSHCRGTVHTGGIQKDHTAGVHTGV